eukprot:SAG31_NODE_4057_length_3630_cov_3.786746_6_plen_317_part_00
MKRRSPSHAEARPDRRPPRRPSCLRQRHSHHAGQCVHLRLWFRCTGRQGLLPGWQQQQRSKLRCSCRRHQYLRMSQNVYLRTSRNVSECLRTYISEHLGISQNISECLRMSQNVYLRTSRNYLRISQNVSECLRMSQNVYLRTSQNVSNAMRQQAASRSADRRQTIASFASPRPRRPRERRRPSFCSRRLSFSSRRPSLRFFAASPLLFSRRPGLLFAPSFSLPPPRHAVVAIVGVSQKPGAAPPSRAAPSVPRSPATLRPSRRAAPAAMPMPPCPWRMGHAWPIYWLHAMPASHLSRSMQYSCTRVPARSTGSCS